eukprot:14657831-Heterocapsa_arctica.AAC.1
MLPEWFGLPCDFVESVQFVLRLGADPFVVQSVTSVASADVPPVEFVLILCEACWAEERRASYRLGKSGLRPSASRQNVPQCSRVVWCRRVQLLQHLPWD